MEHLLTETPTAGEIDGAEALLWEVIANKPGITWGAIRRRRAMRDLVGVFEEQGSSCDEMHILQRLRHVGAVRMVETGYGFHRTLRFFATDKAKL